MNRSSEGLKLVEYASKLTAERDNLRDELAKARRALHLICLAFPPKPLCRDCADGDGIHCSDNPSVFCDPVQDAPRRIKSLVDELAEAREENARLREWVEKADHTEECRNRFEVLAIKECNCGLDELKAQLSILQGQK